jgi:hypothetical protein
MEFSVDYMDIIKLVVSSVGTLLGVFLSWYLKYKYGEYKQKKIDKEITNSKLIQTILDQLLEEYDCQRVFILQRHNGGKYQTGKSMTKLSTSFESLEEGVSTEFRQYQNLPMSLYSTFIEDVSKHKAIYRSVDNIDDLITKAFFSQRGTKSATVYPIKKGQELIGIIGFEWTHTSETFDEIMLKIQDDVKTISETLSKLL